MNEPTESTKPVVECHYNHTKMSQDLSIVQFPRTNLVRSSMDVYHHRVCDIWFISLQRKVWRGNVIWERCIQAHPYQEATDSYVQYSTGEKEKRIPTSSFVCPRTNTIACNAICKIIRTGGTFFTKAKSPAQFALLWLNSFSGIAPTACCYKGACAGFEDSTMVSSFIMTIHPPLHATNATLELINS